MRFVFPFVVTAGLGSLSSHKLTPAPTPSSLPMRTARIFRKVKASEQYVNASIEAANALREDGRILRGASFLENAANQLLLPDEPDAKAVARAGDLFSRVAEFCLLKGSVDRAARTFVKAGKTVAGVDAKQAAEWALRAMQTYPRTARVMSCEVYDDVLGLLLRSNRRDEAVQATRAQIKLLKADESEYGHLIVRAYASIVIIRISQGKMGLASQAMDKGDAETRVFTNSSMRKEVVLLLQAVKAKSAEALAAWKKRTVIRVLNNQVSQLARKLEIDPGWDTSSIKVPASAAEVKQQAAAALGGGITQADGPDDMPDLT